MLYQPRNSCFYVTSTKICKVSGIRNISVREKKVGQSLSKELSPDQLEWWRNSPCQHQAARWVLQFWVLDVKRKVCKSRNWSVWGLTLLETSQGFFKCYEDLRYLPKQTKEASYNCQLTGTSGVLRMALVQHPQHREGAKFLVLLLPMAFIIVVWCSPGMPHLWSGSQHVPEHKGQQTQVFLSV